MRALSQKFASTIHHHTLIFQTSQQTSDRWNVPQTSSFDELLISWNAERPSKGHYVILSRLFIVGQWTPWLLYAVWGSHCQYSFHETTTQAPVHSFQDQVEVLEGQTATGFQIRLEAYQGATLEKFYHLYACTSLLKSTQPVYSPPLNSYPALTVPGLSQLCLPHPRCRSLCSPTSTTAVLHYHLSHCQLNVLNFAQHVYDSAFDVYGNWSFNVAQAFVELGTQWKCLCVRLPQIDLLWDCLKQGLAVVISVCGIFTKSLMPYSNGHLIVIKGYDAASQEFLCIDPAFPCDEQTAIAYPWAELMHAWESRHYLAYLILPRT